MKGKNSTKNKKFRYKLGMVKGRVRLEGLAKILLACGAVLVALPDGFGELSWVGIGSTAFETWSWSPYNVVLDSNDTVLLGVSNCLISFIGSFAELFDSGVVI